MTTFIKTKFKISDDQMNIDKYRLAANITEYHIISKIINESLLQTIVVEINYNIGFGIPIKFPSQKRRKNSNRSITKKMNFWSSESYAVKYNIGFGIPIKFRSQRKK